MATSNSIITLRRHDLDNLRTSLTGLVIFHHTAIAYGGAGQGWRSRLVPFLTDSSSLPLAAFNAYNQTFFMGLFFWMSGHFSAQSLARHDKSDASRWKFIKDKIKHIALPAVAHTLFVMPAIKLVALPEWTTGAIKTCLFTYFRDARGIRGAVWYLATLFVFDVLAACTLPRQNKVSEKSTSVQPTRRDPIYANLGTYAWIPVSVASFFIRIKFPVGKTVQPLGLQLAYASQYVFAYAMGHLSVAKGQQWLSGPFAAGCDTKEDTDSKMGLTTASLLSVSSITLCLLPCFLEGGSDWVARAVRENSGGWNISAFAYAIWNEVSFSIVGPALMIHFYKWYNKATDSNLWKPRYSYATFLVHDLVSVSIEVALDSMLVGSGISPEWVSSGLWRAVGPILMTAVVGCVNSVASFAVAKTLIDNVPWLRRFI